MSASVKSMNFKNNSVTRLLYKDSSFYNRNAKNLPEYYFVPMITVENLLCNKSIGLEAQGSRGQTQLRTTIFLGRKSPDLKSSGKEFKL